MEPKIYSSTDHHIRNDHVNPNALAVLKRLSEAGFTAYLVGGSVRDLLMHHRPKDFDISTSATPEEIKALFRNCILIGKRFRLAHIRFGREIIEVATFRTGESGDELITRDNIWGTPVEDVLRRDFTINGLFYDPLDHKIIDYVGGLDDLKNHLIKTIGDPFVRFKQDPVRMIRMQKFIARFGYQVEETTKQAANACKEEITKSSPARVLEEIFRMLESGHATPFFELLYESELLKFLFPALNELFLGGLKGHVLELLKSVDEMNKRSNYRPLDRSILAASIAFPILEIELHHRFPKTPPPMGAIMELCHDLIHALFVRAFLHFPKKIRFEAESILQMQFRLLPPDKRKRTSHKILRQKGFLQSLTFLKLRALYNPALYKTYEHWKELWKQEEDAGD